MSLELAPPPQARACRILETAPYDRRFRVGRLIPPVGITSSHIRGLHELHRHLAPDIRSLPGVNLAALPEWIAANFGDTELAGGVRDIAGDQAPYVEKCQRIYELVGRRLEQAEGVLAGKAGG
jgi:hypothetical protein